MRESGRREPRCCGRNPYTGLSTTPTRGRAPSATPVSAEGLALQNDLVSQDEALFGDLVTVRNGLMVRRPRFEHGHRACEPRPILDVLEKYHVVRKVRDALLRDAAQLKQVGHLHDHHQADPAPRASLYQRVHPLSKTK